MSNLQDVNDLINMAQSIGEEHVLVAMKRCVAVINRNASCQRCVEACQTNAIVVEKNEVKLDKHLCMACGACTSVCPVEALIPLTPTDAALERASRAARPNAQGAAVFACARIAAKGEVDPDGYVEVPCLARMHESMLVGLASRGVKTIQLVDGNCKTCKYGSCDTVVADCVESANALMAAHGSAVRVERLHAFPESIAKDPGSGADYGAARRAFFLQTKSTTTRSVSQAVTFLSKNEMAKQTMAGKVIDKLGIAGSDPEPTEAVRHESLINAMDALGAPVQEEVTSRQFAMISIEEEKCTSCGICANFCPTKALRRSTRTLPDGSRALLEFDPYLCVQCNMCADICFRDCLTVSPTVAMADLFAMEPVLFRKPSKSARDEGLAFIYRAGRDD